MSDDDDDEFNNFEWIRGLKQTDEYLPIPHVRLVRIFPDNTHSISIVKRPFEFGSDKHPLYDIHDVATFIADIPKHKLASIASNVPYAEYVSAPLTISRDRLLAAHSFPHFFDLHEIVIVYRPRPSTKSAGRTRKSVRFAAGAGAGTRRV